jgi:hypothetical protein
MTGRTLLLAMSLYRPRQEDGDESYVPVEVLESIEDLEQGNTATKEEIEAVLKF